jgi:hypothetical protein
MIGNFQTPLKDILTNIRRGYVGLLVTNTLAYYCLIADNERYYVKVHTLVLNCETFLRVDYYFLS